MPVPAEHVARPGSHHPQGFNVLRILAAAAVLVAHSFKLPGKGDWFIVAFADQRYDLGRLGVITFFAISGYLVTGSWLSEPKVRRFAKKRLLRLYPALLVSLLLTTFLVGPLVTTAADYFTNRGTWLFLLRNLLVVPYDYSLPGVFTNNPTHEVNGVLWTLGIECLAYVLVTVTGAIGVLRRPRLLVPLAVLLLALSCQPLGAVFGSSYRPIAIRFELLATFFLAASVRARGWRPRWWMAVMAAVAVVLPVMAHLPLSIVLSPAAVVIVLWAGLQRWEPIRPVMALGDPSYGMYIYAFVLQQILVRAGLGILNTAAFALLSITGAVILGYVSWHLLEKRALQLVHARRRNDIVVSPPVP